MKTASVLRLDPDLLAGIEEPRASQALHACQAQVLELPQGPWQVDPKRLDRSGFGLLVLSGILCRRVAQSECYGAELIGPGDLMRPWDQLGEWSSIPTESSWLVLQPTRLAILDHGFARRASPFPEIASELLRRGLLRSRYLVILVAIISQRRIDTRLTMLFWHLADRFGKLRGEWVEIPVPLTHATLAELVAARRPSVTTALSRLSAEGILRRSDSGWLLRGTVPPELLQLSETHAPVETNGASARTVSAFS
ncbi:MAG TPA: helix-turn-helix domain-containing protein [Solirubrobacterales bacterium]|nr:helix-turn-helix domain-containing protein [Solirubrobacterales bacterium]